MSPTRQLLTCAAGFALSYGLAAKFAKLPTPAKAAPEQKAAVAFQLPWAERLRENPATAVPTLTGSELNFRNLRAGIKAWAALDAQAAWNFLKALPQQQKGWQQRLARELLETQSVSPAIAEEMWATLPTVWLTGFLGERLALAYAGGNLPETLARAEKMPPSAAQAGFLKIVLAAWAEKDTTAAVDFLAKREMNVHTKELLLHLALTWGKRDPQSAELWLEGLDADGLANGRASILVAMAERDLDAALNLLKNSKNPSAAAIAALAGKLYERDGLAASAWVDGFLAKLDPAGAKLVAKAFFTTWAKHDPTGATAAALLETSDALRLTKLAASSQTWALTAGPAALEYAKSLPADQAAALYRALLNGAGSGKPQDLGALVPTRIAAIDQLQALEKIGAEDAANVGSITSKWAETQPVAALDWAKSQSEAIRGKALNDGLHLGMEVHFEETRNWYEKQPPEIQTLGLEGAARGAAKYQPEVALGWLHHSTAPQASTLLNELYGNWQKENPQSAQNWLNSSGLPKPGKP